MPQKYAYTTGDDTGKTRKFSPVITKDIGYEGFFFGGFTCIIASHSVIKGVWSVAVICPQAAIIRFEAAITSGCCVSVSERVEGSQGASREGKSRRGVFSAGGIV